MWIYLFFFPYPNFNLFFSRVDSLFNIDKCKMRDKNGVYLTCFSLFISCLGTTMAMRVLLFNDTFHVRKCLTDENVPNNQITIQTENVQRHFMTSKKCVHSTSKMGKETYLNNKQK